VNVLLKICLQLKTNCLNIWDYKSEH